MISNNSGVGPDAERKEKSMPKKKEFNPTRGKKEKAPSREGSTSSDKLPKSAQKGDVELSDDDLKDVAGGAFDTYMYFPRNS